MMAGIYISLTEPIVLKKIIYITFQCGTKHKHDEDTALSGSTFCQCLVKVPLWIWDNTKYRQLGFLSTT